MFNSSLQYCRFPGEIKVLLDTSDSTWATNLKFPQLQFPGPRSPDEITGSTPSKFPFQKHNLYKREAASSTHFKLTNNINLQITMVKDFSTSNI